MGVTRVIVEGEIRHERIGAEVTRSWGEQEDGGRDESKLACMMSTMQQQGWNLVTPSGLPYGDGTFSEQGVRAVLIGKLSRRVQHD